MNFRKCLSCTWLSPPHSFGIEPLEASSLGHAKSTFLKQWGPEGGLRQCGWSYTETGRTMTCRAIKQRDLPCNAKSLLVLRKICFHHRLPFLCLLPSPSSKVFFIHKIFAAGESHRNYVVAHSISNGHEAGFMLSNERSSCWWTCSILHLNSSWFPRVIHQGCLLLAFTAGYIKAERKYSLLPFHSVLPRLL